jgi:hypothetical protein
MWGLRRKSDGALARATSSIPRLRAVIDRAVPRPDLAPDLLLVQASFEELDEMYLIEALMDGTRTTRRLELLDGLLASLCTSIDGF